MLSDAAINLLKKKWPKGSDIEDNQAFNELLEGSYIEMIQPIDEPLEWHLTSKGKYAKKALESRWVELSPPVMLSVCVSPASPSFTHCTRPPRSRAADGHMGEPDSPRSRHRRFTSLKVSLTA